MIVLALGASVLLGVGVFSATASADVETTQSVVSGREQAIVGARIKAGAQLASACDRADHGPVYTAGIWQERLQRSTSPTRGATLCGMIDTSTFRGVVPLRSAPVAY